MRAAPHRSLKRAFRLLGACGALTAAASLLGGQWMALQSVAWARMLAEFSRKDSLAVAMKKTFDGQHPCAMCRKIEEKQGGASTSEKAPSPEPLRAPEILAGAGATAAPAPPDFHWFIRASTPLAPPAFVVALPRPVPRVV